MNCPTELMSIIKFVNIKGLNYRLSVTAVIVDNHCVITEADPFDLIVENSTHKCKQVQPGDKYLLQNLSYTGRCPLFTFDEQRGGNLYVDLQPACGTRVENSKIEKCRKIDYGWPKQPQIIKTNHEAVAYCPGEKIRIENTPPLSCPHFPFKLPVTTTFLVGPFMWKGKEVEVPIAPSLQLFRDTINQHVIRHENRFKLELESTKFKLILHTATNYVSHKYVVSVSE